jgi:C1A family cysteine protease
MPIGFKGHVRAPNKDHLIDLSHQRHRHVLRALHSFQTPAVFDSRSLGIIGPIKDQGSCGSCWDFSGTGVVETAFYKAGVLKPDGSQALSEEYTLSCGHNGGCNGDDNVNVLDWAKATGLPLSSDYGPYSASPGRCAWKQGMRLLKVDDWGFADSHGGNGVTPVQDIKNAIIAYGCVGCAVAAGGSSFWNDGQGTDHGKSSNIDHDVILVGWDDNHDGGAWIMRNSWAEKWGSMQGYAWVAYGADSIGTEAVFAVVHSVVPPVVPDWIP